MAVRELDLDWEEIGQNLARQAGQEPDNVAFSVDFFRWFFLRTVLPASCQEPAVRVQLGAAGLFGLTSPVRTTVPAERQLRADSIRQLQQLTNRDATLLAPLFAELAAWTPHQPLPLAYHDQLGGYLGPDTVTGGLRDFYACLQSEDMPDAVQDWTTAETQEALCRLVPQLNALPVAGTAIIASYLKQPLRAIFDSPGFLADLQLLTDLYGLLREELTEEEQWFIETACLEQLPADGPAAEALLRQPNALGGSLRHRLRQQFSEAMTNSPDYHRLQGLLLKTCTGNELKLLEDDFLRRYDVRYFLFEVV